MPDANSILKRIGNYEVNGKRLGKGNFAYVELATNRATKTEVAIKVIETSRINDERIKRCVLREAAILRTINHPNVVRLYETLKQRSTFCIVTEFIAGGELQSYLRSQQDSRLDEPQARVFARQLVSALFYLHEQGIAHRDLKLENILLDETKTKIKIVDFGLSNFYSEDAMLKTQCGSPEYTAPEILSRCSCYGPEVDVWSLGVILYALVTGKLPFRTPHRGPRGRDELLDQVNRGLTLYHNKYLVKLTSDCRDVLRKLLQPDPHSRLPLEDVMVHPWITARATWPLTPYKERVIDGSVLDKVIGQVSQATKIRQSKIAAHVQTRRFDAVCGIYNILLHKELQRTANSDPAGEIRDTRSMRNSGTDDQVISVSITRPGDESRDGDESLVSESSEEIQETIRDSDLILKHRNPQSSDEKPLQSLQIRGQRIYSADPRSPKKRRQCKARPNTANVAEQCDQDSANPMNAQNTQNSTGEDEKFADNIRGRRVVMSPRAGRSGGDGNTASPTRLHAFLPTDETAEGEITGNVSDGSDSDVSSGGDELEAFGDQTKDKSVSSGDSRTASPSSEAGRGIERQGNETLLPGTPRRAKTEETQAKPASVHGKVGPAAENRANATCVQLRPSLPKSTIRSQANGAESTDTVIGNRVGLKEKVSLSEYRRLMSQKVVSPAKNRRLVDMTYKEKYARAHNDMTSPKPPEASAAKSSKPMNESLATIYQCYLANSKPQHRRLSIMQAQEILHHERTFQAKYGKRTDNRWSPENANAKEEPENEASPPADPPRSSLVLSATEPRPNAPTVRDRTPQRARQQQVRSRNVVRPKQRANRGEHRDLPQNFSKRLEPQCRPMAQKRGHRRTPEAIPTGTTPSEHKPKKSDGGTSGSESEADWMKQRQESSLKRQFQLQRQEAVERERDRIQKELEDQDRVGIIQQYLENVYSQQETEPGKCEAKTTAQDNRPRTYKVTPKGRLYSLLPRSPTPPQVVTKTAPMLGQGQQPCRSPAGAGRGGEKRVTFKGTADESKRGIRYLNDWNKTAFVSYINSEAEQGAETEQGQLNDASYWLQQHFNGVVGKATVRDGTPEHAQLVPRHD